MVNRLDPRHQVRLRVQLQGVDSGGHPFKQTVFTHDVSHRGVRLEDAPSIIEPASVIELNHRGQKSRFRVVWVIHTQVGLESLEPAKCIWGRPLPGRPIYSQPPN